MCSKKQKLSRLNETLHSLYQELILVNILLKNAQKFIRNTKKYTPKSFFQILLHKDNIAYKHSLIDNYLIKIDYLKARILIREIQQQVLLIEKSNSFHVDGNTYDYYPPVCIETILGRYDNEKAA